ncbi:magnesium and cobalt transport protein CorA [Luteimicrobium subarcticum]|uniref:Magnesium transporter n=1 Tax=Luteimicrobium subarcticum TaxID=620910 RepID=A0A2M8W1N2_9MICO|nr:magnesium and cobalt transport protein CorA [Luteimicrobium subarcticum]PJI84837.1 magnesium transporter [Luteimicrobium subarcticum]
MPLVDNALYVQGRRIEDPASLDVTFDRMRADGAMAWLGFYQPTVQEIDEVAAELGLHPLAVEDVLTGHQRSKLERYGDSLFLVLRPARYLDDVEEVEVGELAVFVGTDFVVTVRRSQTPRLDEVRRGLEADPDRLAAGPSAVLHALLDQVVDEYAPVLDGLENDVDEIEDHLFGGEGGDDALARRIYFLSREVMSLQRAMAPLVGILRQLEIRWRGHDEDLELQRALRDVADHVAAGVERVDGLRSVLANALDVHTSLVGNRQNETALRQNEQMKQASGWAAILFTPSLVAGIYGMNFSRMPELDWYWGYPFAILLMLVTAGGLYTVFKLKDWL